MLMKVSVIQVMAHDTALRSICLIVKNSPEYGCHDGEISHTGQKDFFCMRLETCYSLGIWKWGSLWIDSLLEPALRGSSRYCSLLALSFSPQGCSLVGTKPKVELRLTGMSFIMQELVHKSSKHLMNSNFDLIVTPHKRSKNHQRCHNSSRCGRKW